VRKHRIANTNQGWMISRADKPGYIIRCIDGELAEDVVNGLALLDLFRDSNFLDHLACKIYAGITDASWAETDHAMQWVSDVLTKIPNEYIKEGGIRDGRSERGTRD